MEKNILKIKINKRDKKAQIFFSDSRVDAVDFNCISGYILFKSFVSSDMLNIQGFNYYEHLDNNQKNILDNLEEIKLNLENDFKSFDFVSDVGWFNLPAMNPMVKE